MAGGGDPVDQKICDIYQAYLAVGQGAYIGYFSV